MKNFFIVSFIVLVAVSSAQATIKCSGKNAEIPKDWLDMSCGCKAEVRRQIQKEIDASIQYMAMGAHFAKHSVNRAGFSEFFFKAAGEEREHAIKLIEYLLMRGQMADDVSGLIKVTNQSEKKCQDDRSNTESDLAECFLAPKTTTWTSGVEALKEALKIEADVTKSIRQVIVKCEEDKTTDSNDIYCVDGPKNDYHLVDYLTDDFLGEQYRGQRDLAGKISTLDKMMTTQGQLGEFLFDKNLLEETK